MLKQITEWNTVKKIWMIGGEDLFSQQSKPFSGRWPISGMMRNGVVYELPMQEHPTTDSESSLSPTLPTPNTMEHREIKTPEQIAELKKRSPGGYRNLRESVINELPDAGLLRTPSVTDSTGVAVRMEMLMTPVASEGLKAPAQQTSETKGKTGQVWLSNQAKDMETNWGKFEPAIRRWESLTRVAPSPTKPDGKDGNHRLSAEFTEWMMGLPEGWVTAEDLGLKRNDQLKACGNGVVPQQAELALRILLDGMSFESTIRGGLSSVLPTPTVMDQRDGKYLRTVAIKNLDKGVNRGLNLNNVVEAIGVDWQDGDTFEMIDGKLEKRTK